MNKYSFVERLTDRNVYLSEDESSNKMNYVIGLYIVDNPTSSNN